MRCLPPVSYTHLDVYKRQPNPFQPGDWVYCQSHPISLAASKRAAKLCYRWSGPYMVFCVPWNLYQYTRVPMGLAVGAQTLTRLLNHVFHDVKFKFIFNYLDDLLVYSKSYEEHLCHPREVMCRLRSTGLTVNPEKVRFTQESISFLGYLVSHRGVTVEDVYKRQH